MEEQGVSPVDPFSRFIERTFFPLLGYQRGHEEFFIGQGALSLQVARVGGADLQFRNIPAPLRAAARGEGHSRADRVRLVYFGSHLGPNSRGPPGGSCRRSRNCSGIINERGRVREEDDLRTILDAGVKVTIPNWNAFAELTRDIHMEFEGELWPEGMVDQIKATQEDD